MNQQNNQDYTAALKESVDVYVLKLILMFIFCGGAGIGFFGCLWCTWKMNRCASDGDAAGVARWQKNFDLIFWIGLLLGLLVCCGCCCGCTPIQFPGKALLNEALEGIFS